MGFFAQRKRSREKTKLMAQLIDAFRNPRDTTTIEEKMKSFYNFIYSDYILGPIIKKYNANYETIKRLIWELNEAVGGHYGGWHKNQFIPVSTFGFANSLECALREYTAGESIEHILCEVEELM